LACKPESLMISHESAEQEEEEDDEEDAEDADDNGNGNGKKSAAGAGSVAIRRAARLLDLQLAQLGLVTASAAEVGDAAAAAGGGAKGLGSWGYGGLTPADRLGCALRAGIRDSGNNFSSRNAVRNAAEQLQNALNSTGTAAAGDAARSSTTQAEVLSPHAMLRYGALGSRIAAAVVSSTSAQSTDERQIGLQALRMMLKEETDRARAASAAVVVDAAEVSQGADELLLRLALVQTLLEDRREAEALQEARSAAKFELSEHIGLPGDKNSPAVNLLLSRCMLRLGHRADGVTVLEAAERSGAAGDACAACCPVAWLAPLWAWGAQEAARLLLAHRAAERCRMAAVDAYARGGFQDSAALFTRALALLQAGFTDDKRGRASLLADRAGCLRRARQLDAAVADLDAALRLFPRYSRALFRRAACLLEAGKAGEALEAFKDLYRADRDWPNLSEWIVRAVSLKKRQAKGYHASGSESQQYDEPSAASGKSDNGSGASDTGSSPRGGKSPGGAAAEADALAREVDHYTVLGVSTDATEKQLKTAYRMRSLQFHPDRKEGHTAAFQRIAAAYEILSDENKRRGYDEGQDIKVKKGQNSDDEEDDDSEAEAEEHKTTLREEVEREYYPERYSFLPFGTLAYLIVLFGVLLVLFL
jgi:tetratricopeptide (TPR) repeat protein